MYISRAPQQFSVLTSHRHTCTVPSLSHCLIPTTRAHMFTYVVVIAEACWQGERPSAQCCLPPRSTCSLARSRCGHQKVFWTRSSSSGTPVRCAVAPAFTHHALPSRLRASSPFRLPSLSPPHTIRRHTARRPNPPLTRTFWLPGADCCRNLDLRYARTSTEQLKALQRRRETRRCVSVRCALAMRVCSFYTRGVIVGP